MRASIAVMSLIALILSSSAHAQRRPRRPRVRHLSSSATLPAVVLRAERTSLREARAELHRHTEAISRCLCEASLRDPVRLSQLRSLQASVTLNLRSRADTVELSPGRLPSGLSLCLAAALGSWSQRSRSYPRARVEVRILVPPR